jgi:sigma-E factor negative regulatory protein RseA
MNREELSALVDGEVADDDITRLLDALADDTGARRAWSRYHLIGDMLRADAAEQPREAPPRDVAPPPPRRPRLPLGGFALAASVAVLAVVLGIDGGGEPALDLAGSDDARAAQVTAAPIGIAPVASVTDPSPVALTPVGVYDERLNGYLVNFNERRSQLGMPGVHPYVRIVGFAAP